MRLTIEQYNDLMLELETTVNYLKSLEPCVETTQDADKLLNAIKALDALTLV